jgi:hypothetical protein
MQDYQKRVIAEAEELHKKIQNLWTFLTTSANAVCPRDSKEYALLCEQQLTMQKYFLILQQRIGLFNQKKEK